MTSVILLGIRSKEQTLEDAKISFQELQDLSRSMGLEEVGTAFQSKVDAGNRIGQGKLEEVKQLFEENNAELLIVDNTLTPHQSRRLERMLNGMVWDRTQLILEVFASHAKTQEAHQQIELAKLQYMLPRLTGMWAHLDRERGGVGVSRGGGEKQIETDRRLARQRITRLKKELKRLERSEETQHKKRLSCLNVSLIGYTNAGKTTLMNSLVGETFHAQNQLFVTLDSTTRLLDKTRRPQILISDTVGFLQNLPHELIASFRSTLKVATSANLLLHVVDASSTYLEKQIDVTLNTLDMIGANCIPRLLVMNQIDRIDWIQKRFLQRRYPDAIFVSAIENTDVVFQKIGEFFDQRMEEIDLVIDYSQTSLLSQIYQLAQVQSIEYSNDGIELQLMISRPNLSKLQHHLIKKWDLNKYSIHR